MIVKGSSKIGLLGATDGTEIGNISDALKVTASISGGTSVPVINRTDVALAARTTSGNSGTLSSEGFFSISAVVNITAVSGTNPTLDIDLESSDDGTNWQTIYTQTRATTASVVFNPGVQNPSLYYRFRWTISGTTPSFTFSVVSTLKTSAAPGLYGRIRYSDISLTADNNVSSTFDGRGSTVVSLMMVRAADGGNNGTVQIQASQNGLVWSSLTGNIGIGPNTITVQTFAAQTFRFWRIIVVANTSAGTRVLDVYWQGSGGS